MVVSLATDLISLQLGKIGINTYPIGNLFILFQTIIFLLIFAQLLGYAKFFRYVIGLYFLFFCLNMAFLQGPFILNSNSHSIGAVMLIVFSLFFFWRVLSDTPQAYITRRPDILVVVSILVYYSGNLFLFMVNNYLSEGAGGNQRSMWIIHNCLNVFKNLVFLICLWLSHPKTNLSSY